MNAFASVTTDDAYFEQRILTFKPSRGRASEQLKHRRISIRVNYGKRRYSFVENSPQSDVRVPGRSLREEHFPQVCRTNNQIVALELPADFCECFNCAFPRFPVSVPKVRNSYRRCGELRLIVTG